MTRVRDRLLFGKRVVDRMGALHLGTYAAGLAYGAVFALVPMLALLVLLLGLFNAVDLVDRANAQLVGVLPADVVSLVDTQLSSVASSESGSFGLGVLVSALIALWGASGAMRRVMEALNVVNAVEDDRSFVRRLLVSFALAVGAVFVIVVTLLVIVVGGDVAASVFDVIGLGERAASVWSWLRWPLLLVLAWSGIAAAYRFAPAHHQGRGFATPGTLIATGGWVGFSLLFSWYVSGIGSMSATWGAVAGIVVFLLYLQYVGLIVLVGALIDAELGDPPTVRQRLRNRLRDAV